MILNEVAKCLTRRSLLQHSAAIAAALAHPCMAASDNRSDRAPPRRPINIVGRWRGFNLLEMFSSPIPVPRGSYCFAAGIQRRHVRTDRQLGVQLCAGADVLLVLGSAFRMGPNERGNP